MTTTGLRFLKGFLVCINLCIIAFYLAACVVPYINTDKYWYIALPGLIFPLVTFGLIFFILIWAFAKSKWCWVSIIVLLIGAQQIHAVFGFNIPKKFKTAKNANTLRVLQWNVSSWDERKKKWKGGVSYRPVMMDLVKELDADVLCFEEFFEPKDTSYFVPNISTITNMGYAYHYFIPTRAFENDYQSGIAIFSKYPITDSAFFSFKKNNSAEHLLYTDIKVDNRVFRIFATHLQSVHFNESDLESLSRLKHAHEEGLRDTRTIISKLKRGYESRYEQAELVNQKMQESPYPTLICGDFNDVPNSNTYFKISGGLQDAFLKKVPGSAVRSGLFLQP